MPNQGVMGGFYRVSEWVMRLAYINILWIFFSIIGLVIFGVMPATVAMFTVIRKWLMGEEDVHITKLFFKTYKKEFIKVNLLGLIIFAIGYILYIDLQFLSQVSGMLQYILTAGLIIIGFFFLIMVIYIIPVYVHYDLKVLQYLRHSILIGFLSPLMTIMMIATLSVIYYLFMFIPGLIPVFGASAFGFITMGSAYFAFKRLETKQQKVEEAKEVAQ
ncbi:YesL family protein [Halalkalibacter kiskunsagensis]|uniref:YesL family protein n=1 Tax=Halalkalibacter kiskunsagensis TaxID=1548599 RepID=A0ABV6KJ95_9BACI